MMKSPGHRTVTTLIIYCLLISPSLTPAQQPNQAQKSEPQPGRAQKEPDKVVRISTQLVQIDAVVTDNKGGHIENLTEKDFELTVDGKRQTLTYFTLVKLPEPKEIEPGRSTNTAAPLPNLPPKTITQENINRTIAFVVDDLGLSFESIYLARRALKKFVDEQMREGDLVGFILTGRGAGALQQFTNDKRILYAALEKMTWNPFSRDMRANFSGPNENRTEEAQAAEEGFADFRETVFSSGTLGSLNFVVRSLRQLPGRKMAILLSDGFRLFGRRGRDTQILEQVRRLADLANRSSVVIYSIDAKGLQTLNPTAADKLGASGPRYAELLSLASRNNFESQEGLSFLARETGGFAVLNNNDLDHGVQRALADAQSYYLLGFDPEDEKFDKKYHSIKLKVKRQGMQVRTRAGFLGFNDRPEIEEIVEQTGGVETRSRQILSALSSPFGARDLTMQMTSFFFNGEQAGSFVRSVYNLDPSKLTFKDDPEHPGHKTVSFDFVSFTFNESGQVVDSHGRTFTLSKISEDKYQLMLKKGLFYNDDFIIKKPGAYQLRTVLRDFETGRLGSASQFIQVPDLTKKRLTLSGMVLVGSPQEATEPPPEKPAESDEVNTSLAVRRFPGHGELIMPQ
ncbi:MAG: VWA domain-containing protein [Acidobacteria bacterium]|nr:VWA domain-containing protein [Acidobacteriota bacterium]